MQKPLLKMLPNRVRRNYLGGSYLDRMRGIPSSGVGDRPEEWLCSTVEATNPGLEVIEDEGLSSLLIDGRKDTLVSILKSNPEYYLGKDRYEPLSFLVKWLDSSIRLHMQAHPTKDFSRKYLGCDYGKFEAYYVLAVRENIKEPYIRLGFQKNITKEEWGDIVSRQDIAKMDSLFEKIPVKPGDVIYIPGGMPHAIGEGIFLLEMMEPSDLVVRCEFEREGIVVPEKARFMNRGLYFCLDIFNYTCYSKDEIRKNFFLTPKLTEEGDGYRREILLTDSLSGCFNVERITVSKEAVLKKDDRYGVIVCTKGKGTIRCSGTEEDISLLDSFFVAAETEDMKVSPAGGELEFCLITPKRK